MTKALISTLTLLISVIDLVLVEHDDDDVDDDVDDDDDDDDDDVSNDINYDDDNHVLLFFPTINPLSVLFIPFYTLFPCLSTYFYRNEYSSFWAICVTRTTIINS
jgi:hypothetical protein